MAQNKEQGNEMRADGDCHVDEDGVRQMGFAAFS